MKAKRLWLIVLAPLLAALVFAGCKNGDDVVALVGETPVYRWYFDAYLNKQLALYVKLNGVDLTRPENRATFEEYKILRLDDLVDEAAMREEARTLGLDELSAEEEAVIDQNYLAYYNSVTAYYLEQYGTDEAGAKKAEQAYIAFLKESGLTPARARADMRDAFIINKYVDHVAGIMELTEEELKARYDNEVAVYQMQCNNNPAWFGENVSDPVVYAPEGYRDTARITLRFNDAQLLKLQTAAQNAQDAVDKYNDLVTLHGEGAGQVERQIAVMEKAQEAFESVREECLGELADEIRELRQQVLDGADFIELMEEKSQDTHLISYFVHEGSTHLEASYKAAALQLQNEGDISDVVYLSDGVCIIKLMEFIEPGARPYESVKDALRTRIVNNSKLNDKVSLQTECGNAARAAGIVQTFPEKLK